MDGREYQPFIQRVRLVHLDPWCGIGRGGRKPAVPYLPSDDGGVDMKCPTEIAISDRREAELRKWLYAAGAS